MECGNRTKERVLSEKRQNLELLTRRGLLKYGDVVQFQHIRSGLFVRMDKSPALLNSLCNHVGLGEGGPQAHFQVVPRFKVRSLGSLVYREDEV